MLELKGICKAFGGAPAVAGIDLRVEPGELVSLLGPSGCGKTTLLRILAGFERPDAGEIRLAGARIDGMPPNLRPCHMIFQRYALFPHLDVFGNVAFPLTLRRVAKAEVARRVGDALALVEMQDFARRGVQTLSGGQQQRVAIARAIVDEPRFLLLDEPLAALDLKLRQKMQIELLRLQRRLGITFIFVTHAQDEALTLSDRVAVMRNGRIEQVGTPRAIYDEPATLFVASFVGSVNRVAGRAAARGARVEAEGLGALRAGASAGVAEGAAAVLTVRPERVRLAPAGAAVRPDEDALAVVVTDVLFKGAHLEVHAHAADRPGIALTAQLGAGAAVPERGARATFAWDVADARALPADAEAEASP